MITMAAMRRAAFLPKKPALIGLGMLLLLDTIFDVLRGTQGNPLFKPIENAFGIWAFPLLVPLALAFFYAVVKFVGMVVQKTDPVPHVEEILFTALVIIFAVHDTLIFFADYLGVRLITSFPQMIILYTAIGFGYSLWAEHETKK